MFQNFIDFVSGLFAELICFFCQYCAATISNATKDLIRAGGVTYGEEMKDEATYGESAPAQEEYQAPEGIAAEKVENYTEVSATIIVFRIVSKFPENIAGEKKDYSNAHIDALVEILRTAAGNWHENYEGKIHNDKLSEIFEKKNLDFDCWVVTDMPATGKIDIQPDGVVTQQNLFDFIDCMCGATAPESNQKDFSGIESILKSHINNNNFPEKVKALVNDFNLVQYMKDTG